MLVNAFNKQGSITMFRSIKYLCRSNNGFHILDFAHSLFTYGILKSQMGLPPAIDRMLNANRPV